MGFPDAEKLLEHARREVDAGESFFEFRLDYLADPEEGVEAIRRLLEQHPDCTILATCRRHQNQGRFNGSIEDQVRILDAAVDAGARAVDVEIESAENVAARLDHFRGRALVVLSYHNFEGTPALESVFRRMQKVGADAYKLATTARKPSDNYRLLALAKSNPRVPLILLSMGEIGFATRVLSPAWGGLFTYAAPNAVEGTAAGQVSARHLRHTYRVRQVFTSGEDVWRHRGSREAFYFACGPQSRIPSAAAGRDISSIPGPPAPAQGFFRSSGRTATGRIQRDASA